VSFSKFVDKMLNEGDAVETTLYVITGTVSGKKVYWRKWTSDTQAGKPKWVTDFSLKSCSYNSYGVAKKTDVNNSISDGVDVKDIKIQKLQLKYIFSDV